MRAVQMVGCWVVPRVVATVVKKAGKTADRMALMMAELMVGCRVVRKVR